MKGPGERLSPARIAELIKNYGQYGLREGVGQDMEYLILPVEKEDGTKEEIFMHKFKFLGNIPIEERIKQHLSSLIKWVEEAEAAKRRRAALERMGDRWDKKED